MDHQLINPSDFIGKTIERVDARAVNIVTFYFTDMTHISIEIEGLGGGIMGLVSCDHCAANDEINEVLT